MERKYPHKEWSQLYKERTLVIQKEKESPASDRHRKDLQITTKAGTLIARKIGKRVRIKLANKAYSCRRTIENLTFPKTLKEWKVHWGSQLICSICTSPALYDCTTCTTCNAIAHRLCVAEQHILKSQLNQMSSLSLGTGLIEGGEEEDDDDYSDDGADLFGEGKQGDNNFESTMMALGMDEYSCLDCQASYQDDVNYFEKLKVLLTKDRRYVLAMRLICRRILCYIERRRFKKLKTGLVIIQSCIRKRKAKRNFFYWRRSQLRTIWIDILHLPASSVQLNDLIVLTAVDPMKNAQLFRFDKTAAQAMEEGFLIPGITSHVTVVISVCRVEEHTANTVYIVLDQCQLSLRDIDAFLEKLPYSLSFGKRIWWMPQDHKKDFPYRLVAEKTGGIVQATASGHHAHTGQHVGAGNHAHGESKESKDDSAIHAQSSTVSLNNPSSTAPPVHTLQDSDHFVRVFYSPQNPISSVVCLISGPPLDILRTPAVTDVHQLTRNRTKTKNKDDDKKLDTRDQGPQGRATRWWICLCNLRIYFYQNYGDVKPRLISDISDAQLCVDNTYTKGNVISILHADSRLWLLELADFKSAQKLEFAFVESKKAFKQTGGSIFMKSSEIRKRRIFGFENEIL